MSNIERTKYTNELLGKYRNIFVKIIDAIDAVMTTNNYFSECCRNNGINYHMLRILMQTQTFQKLDLTGNMLKEIPNLSVDLFMEDPYVHFYKDILDISDEDIVKVPIPLDLKDGIEYVLQQLNEKEQFILRNRYGLNDSEETKTLEEIGNNLNVTRERVRQIETKAIHKCRTSNNLPYIRLGKELAELDIKTRKELLQNEITNKQNNLPNNTHKSNILVEDIKIENLDLSVRSYNALVNANIHTLKELLELEITDLFSIRNLGKTSIVELIKIINTYK